MLINAHGMIESEIDTFKSLGWPMIYAKPHLTALLFDEAGYAISPSTGVVEVLALSARKVKQIHLIDKRKLSRLNRYGIYDKKFTEKRLNHIGERYYKALEIDYDKVKESGEDIAAQEAISEFIEGGNTVVRF